MVRLCRSRLQTNKSEKIFELLFQTVGKSKNKSEFNALIDSLLSPTEKIMVAKRLAIMYLLLNNKTSITICSVLKVSKATVAKFSLLLQENDGVLIHFLTSIKQNKELNKTFESIFLDTFFSPGIPGTHWASAWKRKNANEREINEGL